MGAQMELHVDRRLPMCDKDINPKRGTRSGRLGAEDTFRQLFTYDDHPLSTLFVLGGCFEAVARVGEEGDTCASSFPISARQLEIGRAHV